MKILPRKDKIFWVWCSSIIFGGVFFGEMGMWVAAIVGFIISMVVYKYTKIWED